MKLSVVFALLSGLLINTGVYAGPPIAAVLEGEHFQFSRTSCLEAVKAVLKREGFVDIAPKNTTVFANYRKGKQRYKAIIRCLEKYDLVTVTVISPHSGSMKKAQSFLTRLKSYAQADIDPNVFFEPDYLVVNCRQPTILAQCLSSIPPEDINATIDTLLRRQQALANLPRY